MLSKSISDYKYSSQPTYKYEYNVAVNHNSSLKPKYNIRKRKKDARKYNWGIYVYSFSGNCTIHIWTIRLTDKVRVGKRPSENCMWLVRNKAYNITEKIAVL